MSAPLFHPQAMPDATTLGIAGPLERAVRVVQSYLVHRRPVLGLALARPDDPNAPQAVEIQGTILWPVRALRLPRHLNAPPIPLPHAVLPLVVVNVGSWTARLAVVAPRPPEAGFHFAVLTGPSLAGDTASLSLQWGPLPLTGPETPTGLALGEWLVAMVDEGLTGQPTLTEIPPPAP